MTEDPTNSEVMRRLDDLVARLERLAQSLDEGYVRKDVQEARELATAMQLKGHEDELHMLHRRLDMMVNVRDKERDDRDRLRQSDRRLFYALTLSVLVGPLLVALLLHATHVR